MDAHWITVMNNISFVTYLIQLLFFIASIFLTKLLLKRQDSSRYIRLNGMLLDTELCKVFIGNRECILRNAEFRLLMLFVNKRDHSLSRQEIHTQLWPEIDNPDNRINNLISTLRKALKDFPGCSLDMGEDKIYRLRILGWLLLLSQNMFVRINNNIEPIPYRVSYKADFFRSWEKNFSHLSLYIFPVAKIPWDSIFGQNEFVKILLLQQIAYRRLIVAKLGCFVDNLFRFAVAIG